MTVANEGVPALGKIGIGGRSYTAEIAKIVRQTMPLLRSRPDQSNEPGEQAISYENVWPRSQHDWRLGSGQLYFDEDDGNRHRFSQSFNVNPWNQREISLLLNTTNTHAMSGAGRCKATMAGPIIYVFHTTTLQYSLVPTSTWFTVSGGLASAGLDMSASGAHVYIGTTAGIYRIPIAQTSPGPTLFSAFALNSSVAYTIGVANGRLIAGNGTRLVEIDSSGGYGAVGQLDFTHPLGRSWYSIAGAPNGIYVGSAGFGSDIYLLSVNPNTGGLVPTLAMTLPNGEGLNTMIFYGGIMVLGTDRGIRLANLSGDGSLIYGPLIRIGVQDPDTAAGIFGTTALHGRGEFVWFGWSDPVPGYTGVGRLALSRFTEPLVPAYAPDFQFSSGSSYANIGPNSIVATEASYNAINANVYFTFGSGLWGNELTTRAATGYFRTGQITFGTTERKTAVAVDWRTKPLPAGSSIAVAIAVDGGAFTTISTDSTTGSTGPSTPVAITGVPAGEDYELKFTFTRGTDTSTSPTLKRWTLRVMPTPPRVDAIRIPIILHGQVDPDLGMEGIDDPKNTLEEYLFLKGLETEGTVIDLVIGSRTDKVKIDQMTTEPVQWNDNRDFFNCTLTVQMLTVTPLSEIP